MRVEHVRKRSDERLWLADAVVGAYMAQRLHAEAVPWELLEAAHCIDVIHDDVG